MGYRKRNYTYYLTTGLYIFKTFLTWKAYKRRVEQSVQLLYWHGPAIDIQVCVIVTRLEWVTSHAETSKLSPLLCLSHSSFMEGQHYIPLQWLLYSPYSSREFAIPGANAVKLIGFSSHANVAGWSIVGSTDFIFIANFLFPYRSTHLGNYSRLACDIQFVRSMGYYLIQIYIPSSRKQRLISFFPIFKNMTKTCFLPSPQWLSWSRGSLSGWIVMLLLPGSH